MPDKCPNGSLHGANGQALNAERRSLSPERHGAGIAEQRRAPRAGAAPLVLLLVGFVLRRGLPRRPRCCPLPRACFAASRTSASRRFATARLAAAPLGSVRVASTC